MRVGNKQSSKIAAWYFNAELDQDHTKNIKITNIFGMLIFMRILDHMELSLDYNDYFIQFLPKYPLFQFLF